MIVKKNRPPPPLETDFRKTPTERSFTAALRAKWFPSSFSPSYLFFSFSFVFFFYFSVYFFFFLFYFTSASASASSLSVSSSPKLRRIATRKGRLRRTWKCSALTAPLKRLALPSQEKKQQFFFNVDTLKCNVVSRRWLEACRTGSPNSAQSKVSKRPTRRPEHRNHPNRP